ncbi:hypothetical protein M8C21_024325, partial [Ambrosia artemisiifolia]
RVRRTPVHVWRGGGVDSFNSCTKELAILCKIL